MKTNIDKIIEEHLGVVESLAKQYVCKAPGMILSDFISEGNMALVIAAQKWDENKEPVFARYAIYHIRKAMENILPTGEIKQDITDKLSAGRPYTNDAVEEAELSEDMQQRIETLNDREREVIESFYGVNNKERLTMTEIANNMKIKRERVRQIRKTAERKMRRK